MTKGSAPQSGSLLSGLHKASCGPVEAWWKVVLPYFSFKAAIKRYGIVASLIPTNDNPEVGPVNLLYCGLLPCALGTVD